MDVSRGEGEGRQPVVESPDGRIRVTLLRRDRAERYGREGGCLYYRVERDGETVVAESRLGLDLLGAPSLASGFQFGGVEETQAENTWRPVFGERSVVADSYREIAVTAEETLPPGRRLVVRVRAFDGGFALRYELNIPGGCVIGGEKTEYRFAEGSRGYQQRWPEDEYRLLPLAELDPETERPLTVLLPSAKLAVVAEAGNIDYSRMLLGPAGDGALQVRLSGSARASDTFRSPWRVVLFADAPVELIGRAAQLESLCPPCALADTSWIRPGKAIREVTLSTRGGRACIDFAVKNGLQYILYDAGWYGFEYDEASDARAVSLDPDRVGSIPDHGGLDLREVIRYGREKGIGVFVYVNRRALERQLDDILPIYAGWGVAGIKFGFVNTGPGEWTAWLHDAVRKCAEHRLMVDIHDYYRPTGLTRTWPNLLTQEGTRGNEHFPTPRHNVTLPFTRFTAGAADYTICYRQARLQTTDAHQLAMAAVYYSPLQLIYWYSRPSDYPPLPEMEWFARVPSVWDETVGVAGAIGEYVAVARRSGEEWYLGAMTDEHGRTLDLPLDFLGEGDWQTVIYRDDPEAADTGEAGSRIAIERRTVTAATVLREALKPAGGVAVRIARAAGR